MISKLSSLIFRKIRKTNAKTGSLFRTRVFEQKFTLPTGVKGDRVSSSINKDGVLTITAPRGNASASSVNQVTNPIDLNLI